MLKMVKIFFTAFAIIISAIISVEMAFAQPPTLLLNGAGSATGSVVHTEFISIPASGSAGDGLISVLSLIQNLLLKVVLPLVAVGCGLYIAYIMFTAEGDESKMKTVWTAVTYTIVGIVTIMLAYFVVDLISRINIA